MSACFWGWGVYTDNNETETGHWRLGEKTDPHSTRGEPLALLSLLQEMGETWAEIISPTFCAVKEAFPDRRGHSASCCAATVLMLFSMTGRVRGFGSYNSQIHCHVSRISISKTCDGHMSPQKSKEKHFIYFFAQLSTNSHYCNSLQFSLNQI